MSSPDDTKTTTPDSPSEHPVFRGGLLGALGFRFTHVDKERVDLVFTVGPEHLQPFGLVHGGVHAAVVETVCSIGAHLNVAPGQAAVGMENHSSFLRPVRSGTLTASGVPIHRGRQSQLWEATIKDEQGRLVATGRLRLACIDAAPKGP